MKWLDVEDIAESLEDNHPQVDLWGLRFTDLRNMVTALPDFSDEHDGCNERILEAIQSEWWKLRED